MNGRMEKQSWEGMVQGPCCPSHFTMAGLASLVKIGGHGYAGRPMFHFLCPAGEAGASPRSLLSLFQLHNEYHPFFPKDEVIFLEST